LRGSRGPRPIRQLAAWDGAATTVIDVHTGAGTSLGAVSLANDSMSWSPDNRMILGYDQKALAYVIVPVGDGAPSVLPPPPDGLRPLGWAGSRVVWLAGGPGQQNLVTTDQRGGSPREWMRLAIDDPVESVTWSRELSG
jgi:hypothetical protein